MIDKHKTTELFNELGFINSNLDNLALFSKIWKFLNIFDKDQVLVYNIKVITCSIMNFNKEWMNQPDVTERSVSISGM